MIGFAWGAEKVRQAWAIRGALLVVAGVAFWWPTIVSAQTPCSGPADAPVLDSAESAITAWESSRGYKLTSPARGYVVYVFCSTAAQLVEEQGVDRAAISGAAREPIWTYLDEMLTPGNTTTGLADLLAARFALGSSPALPEPKRMGVLRMTYRRTVSRLQIGSTRLSPAPVFLTEAGLQRVEGFNGPRRVCSGNVTITRTPTSFVC